jgi:hypothetical protein
MAKQCAAYTDAELKFLIRYGTESYQSLLEATTKLRDQVEADAPKEKPEGTKKPRPAP